MTKIKKKQQDVADFLTAVFLKEMETLVTYSTTPYISFMPLIQGIEYLGAIQDDHDFEKRYESECRFNKGLKLMGDRYLDIKSKSGQKVDLYHDFRCPMIHQFRHEQSKITLTHRFNNPVIFEHLSFDWEDKLVIVLDDFYGDIKSAAEELIKKILLGEISHTKVKNPFLTLRTIEELAKNISS
jgi:hypothetical protein